MKTRYEKKFWCSYAQYQQIKTFAQFAMSPDPYSRNGPYWVLTKYFDTQNHSCYQDNAEGEWKKVKIRLRGYGTDWSTVSSAHWEAKIKNDTRQIKLKRLRPKNCFRPPTELCVQLGATLRGEDLFEVGDIRYQRMAFQIGHHLRLTFDHNISVRPQGRNDWQNYQRNFLMEIKGDDFELPSYLQRLIKQAGVQIISFSKFSLLHHQGYLC